MAPLAPELRRDLERAVLYAREVAERGARAALQVLAVDAERAFDTLSGAQRSERTALRARMKALAAGDTSYQGLMGGPPKGFAPLIEEVAYEQWHRMLFARFLEQNNLLIHPHHGVPVSLDECADVAADEGEPDEWMVAAKFAGAMLPGIFQRDDPAVRVRFAANDRNELERILKSLPSELFNSDDALGWVYQFWQSERKDQVNKRGDKIGGADLPPVTQFFTEHYMVRFLLENSLGAWWADRHPNSPLLREWEYLRFRHDGTPAAGTYDDWPERTAEVTVMDPCCGSGHFLVAAADMLRKMRMEEENLTPAQAAAGVLRLNLFGVELDPRCLQLAAFNLALDAWKAGGYQTLPLPNLACSGIAIKGQRGDWHHLAAHDDRMSDALDRLYDLFQDAPELGSLIDPRSAASAGLWSVDVDALLAKLDRALQREAANDPAAAVFGAAVAGTAKAAKLLVARYWLVATNPPYLARGKQDEILRLHCEKFFPGAASDLATVFVLRCLQLATASGTTALLTPQNWLYLKSYGTLRRHLLGSATVRMLATVGSGATSTASWEVTRALTVIDNAVPRSDARLSGVRVLTALPYEREAGLAREPVADSTVSSLLKNPDARFALGAETNLNLLSEYADSYQGIATADYPRFGRYIWECPPGSWDRWARQQSTVGETELFGGREHAILWENGAGALRSYPQAAIRGTQALGLRGIAVTQTRNLPATLFSGTLFDNNTAVLIPKSENLLAAVWVYVTSPQFVTEVRRIDQKLFVTNSTLTKVPFDVERWRKVADEQYPHGLPEANSDDPTQWLFKGGVVAARAPLHVAVARLLGHRWPDQKPDALDQHSAVDGVVCVPALPGQQSAQERLRGLLVTGYSERWSASTIDELLAAVGSRDASLENWLRDGFFEQHCKLFHHRPFVWQVWDGRRDGFSALVNYHRLDRPTLEKLAYTYIGSWLERQRDEKNSGVPGADDRLAAAQGLQRKLALILEGEDPYDIFVRWKKDQEQAVGWNPDLDDGVRLNIRPFIAAGVLRWKPNIKWDKDRGRNPDGSDRVNDCHMTIAAKREARARAERSS